MFLIRKNLIVFGIIFFLVGCSNTSSYILDGESVVVEITRDKEFKEPLIDIGKLYPKKDVVYAGSAGYGELAGVASYAVDFLVKETAKALKNESEKYTAQYAGFVSDDTFYSSYSPSPVSCIENIGESKPVAVKGINITRFVEIKGVQKKAFKAVLDFEFTRNFDYFRIKPFKVGMAFSKAKCAGDSVDVDLKIEVHEIWKDKKELKTRNNLIASVDIPLRGLKYKPSIEEDTNLDNLNPNNFQVYSQFIPAIRRSYLGYVDNDDDKKVYGLGNYVINVIVTETDEFGEQIKRVSTLLEDNREKIVDSVKKESEKFKESE